MLQEIACPDCHWHRLVGTVEKLRLLHQVGMLRREENPDVALIDELFHRSGGKLPCGECGRIGLEIDFPRDEEEDWGDGRVCEKCRKTIPAERLEIFPNTKICVTCQQKEESGEDDTTPDFCPKCGEIMTAGTTRGGGVTRYRLRCPRCR